MSDQTTNLESSSAPPLPRVNPLVVLWLGVLSLSTGSILVRWCESPPLVTAAWRMTIAAGVVLPFALGRARSELTGLSRRELGAGMLSGALLALHFATWITSLGLTSVAASTVLVNTAPVWVALCAPWFTKDRTRWTGWIGIASSLAGGVVIGFGDFAADRAGGRDALRGDALALAGGIALALYLVTGRRLRARTSLVAYLAMCYTTAAVVLWVCVCCAGQARFGFSDRTWVALVWMGVVNQHLGQSSYNWAMRYLSAGLVSACLLGEPLIGSLLAWWLFGETLSPAMAGAGLLILSGVYLAGNSTQPSTSSNPAGSVAGGPRG